MTQKWLQFQREILSDPIRPIYVLAGEEVFQIEEAIAAVRKKLLGTGSENNDFLLELFDGEGLEGSALISAVQRLPGLFDAQDSKRLVICRRFDKASAAVLESMAGYWEDPNPSTCLVLTVHKLDKRKAWVKHIEERGFVLETHEPFDRDWPRWQVYFERKLAKQFGPAAWDTLVESSGRSLSNAWMESTKLASYVGTQPKITREDVQLVVGNHPESDIFAFCEDVANGELLAAHTKYRKLISTGESEIKLLALLLRLFRQVRICRALLDRGITDNRQFASEAGIPPFVVPKRLQQARALTLGRLDHVLKILADTDYRLKMGKGTLFDNLLIEAAPWIARPSSSAR